MDRKMRVILLVLVAAGICESTIVSPDPNAKSCPSVRRADIIFMVDESGSVKPFGWELQKEFINKLVGELSISKDEVQVGLLTFSNGVRKKFDLNKYYNAKTIQKTVAAMPYGKGSTHTHKALDLAGEMFHEKYGARPNVQKIGIMMTDGKSSWPPKTQVSAARLKASGVKVIVVAIKRAPKYEAEMKGMASADKYLIHVKDMYALTKTDAIHNEVMVSMKCAVKCEKVQKADIVFLLDSSLSIGEPIFKGAKSLVNRMVKDLDVGQGKVHIGLATMSFKAHKELALKDSNNPEEIGKIVEKLTWRKGMTHTDKALKFIGEEFFSKKGGQREKIKHILLFVTDGSSSNKNTTNKEAKLLKRAGVEIIAVGVGKNIDEDELNKIASGKHLVIKIDTLDAAKINALKNDIIQSVNCPA